MRKDGDTAIIIRTIFEELEKEGILTELIQLPDIHIKPCRITQGKDCLACMGKENCVFEDDDFCDIFEKIKEADGLILSSPVYGADVTAEMKIFLDRIGLTGIGNPDALRHKPGAAVCALVMLANFLKLPAFARTLLIVAALLVAIVGIGAAAMLEIRARYFECPHCKALFVPTMAQYIKGCHTLKKRWLTCPRCGKAGMCKHRIAK